MNLTKLVKGEAVRCRIQTMEMGQIDRSCCKSVPIAIGLLMGIVNAGLKRAYVEFEESTNCGWRRDWLHKQTVFVSFPLRPFFNNPLIRMGLLTPFVISLLDDPNHYNMDDHRLSNTPPTWKTNNLLSTSESEAKFYSIWNIIALVLISFYCVQRIQFVYQEL